MPPPTWCGSGAAVSGRVGDGDGLSARPAQVVSEEAFIGLLLSNLIGGDVVPFSLCGLEPPPPFVVMWPPVLEGGRGAWSKESVVLGLPAGSMGERDLARRSGVLGERLPPPPQPDGSGEEAVVQGGKGSAAVDSDGDGDCALR